MTLQRRILPYCIVLATCQILPIVANAQDITHGPVFGALTHNTTRMYVRTQVPSTIQIEIDTNAAFGAPVVLADSTRQATDSSTIVQFAGLQPDTRYYVRIRVNGNPPDARQGMFRTFPVPGQRGNYVFTTGSCQESPNMKVFDVMPLHNPYIFLHTGDYTYPDYQIGGAYPRQKWSISESWRRRYNENRMRDMLLQVPIDYVPDDGDGLGNSGWRWGFDGNSYTLNAMGLAVNTIWDDTIGVHGRRNVIDGYATYFPHYPLADTAEGLFHKFTLGNAEIFFVDTRMARTPLDKGMKYNALLNLWSFNPDPDHTLLGDIQRNWLLQNLQQSTADWKFIVSGVPFNKNLKRMIDVGLLAQSLVLTIGGQTRTAFDLAASFGRYWVGYPLDQQTLLAFLADNNIKDVLMVSGETHHSVMDDGLNAGLPELNESGLSVPPGDKRLAFLIDSVGQALGQPPVIDSLWNHGGGGIGNTNFKTTFGKVQIFERDSVQMCIIDEDDHPITCMTIRHSSLNVVGQPDLQAAAAATQHPVARVYPNPTQGQFAVALSEGFRPLASDGLRIQDVGGRTVWQGPQGLFHARQARTTELDVRHLAAGTYFLVYTQGRAEFFRKLVVE